MSSQQANKEQISFSADKVRVMWNIQAIMANPIDDIYFQELAALDPKEASRRTHCIYNQDRRSYSIKVWDDEYEIFPHENRIERVGGSERRPHEFFLLFIVYYLLKSQGIPAAGVWISEKDIPGGATFFRGPHEIPTRLISERFGNDIETFKERCEQLHGTSLDMGDAAYRFDITSNIPVAVVYWAGDDEFPPEANIMFDKTISEHLPPDIVFSLAVEICARIGNT